MKPFDKKAFLDKTFESSLDAIIFTDEKGCILEANQAYAELTGYKKDEIIGKHTSEFSPMKEGTYECTTGELIQIDKKFSTQLRATMKAYVEKGKLQNVMGYQLRKDHKIVPVEDSMVFLVGDDGERIGGVAVIRDNTQRRKAEIEIQKTKEYLENIFMTSVDGVIIADDEGKIAAVNKAIERMFDCSSDQLVGKHISEMEYHDVESQISGQELVERLLSEGSISGVERIVKKPDGTAVVIEMNIALLKDDKRNVTGSVASIRDITDRKRAEEALKESEEKYYKLIENANDAIVSVNINGMIIGFNKKAEEMFGYSREEVMEKPAYVLISDQRRKKYKETLGQLLKNGTVIERESTIVEGGGRRKEGKEFPVEYSYYTINIMGQFIATAIIRDISKRKEAEQRIINYQKQLKALSTELLLTEQKERQQFADFLHDEVGQQLFATRLQLEQLKDSLSSAKNTKTLDKALNNLYQLMNQARSLTSELSSPLLQQFGLEKALEWLAEQTHKKYDILVTFEDDKEEKPLDDSTKLLLYQSVSELFTNIAKHAQTKSASISIKRDASNLQICVEDSGVGFLIPNGDSSDATKAGGIGLFRIKERLELLGGQLKIKSQPNRGTQVILIVPLKNIT